MAIPRPNGQVLVWKRGDTVPTDAEGGYAGGDSTAAAVGTALAQADAAQQTIQNLQGAATTLPYGANPTVSVSGSGTSKVINIGIPLGMPSDIGGTLVAAAQSAQADAAQSAEEVTLALQAQFLTQDEGVEALVDTAAGPKTQAALKALRRASAVIEDVRDHGAKGDGATDDTAAIQAAVDYVSAEGGGTVMVPPGMTCMIAADSGGSIWNNAGGIDLKDGVTLHISKGSTLKAKPVTTTVSKIVRIHERTGVRVTGGGTIDGNRANAVVATGEWGYGVSVSGGSHIILDDFRAINCWGDGVNLQRPSFANYTAPRWVIINGIECRNNRRQGMSIESGWMVNVSDSTFADTNGALPMCGIDIEPPDVKGTVDHVTISRCLFTGNARAGVQAWESTKTNDIRVIDCTFDSNGATGSMPQIRLHSAGRTTHIIGNTCTNSPGTYSIEMAGPLTGGRISDNRTDKGITAFSLGIIASVPRGLSVRDNTVEGGTLAIHSQLGAVIEGNYIKPALGQHAIDMSGAGQMAHAKIINNTIDGGLNGIHGNESVTSSYVYITGNTFIHTTGPAITMKGGDAFEIVGNTFEGCCLTSGTAIIYDLADAAAVRRRIQHNIFKVAPRPGTTASQTPAYAYQSDATKLQASTVKDNTISSYGYTFATFPPTQSASGGGVVLSEGASLTPARGTAYRPVNAVEGQAYFDTTLGKPIWRKSTAWVDATGAAV